jgi:uncharacterized protein (UPF0332 family)
MKESFYNRANENLKAAELLFDAGLYNASANRAYYSAFHVTIAYLFDKGFEPVIDHKNVFSLFINELINKKKIFPSLYSKLIYELQDNRNLADYESGISKRKSVNHLKKIQTIY